MNFETAALLLAWVVILLLAFGMSGLLAQVRDLRSAMSPQSMRAGGTGPRVGERVPSELDQYGDQDMPTIALFADADCATCNELLPLVMELAAANTNTVQCLMAFRGSANGFKQGPVTVLEGMVGMFENLEIQVTPFGMIVSDGKVVHAHPIGSASGVEHLFRVAREKAGSEVDSG